MSNKDNVNILNEIFKENWYVIIVFIILIVYILLSKICLNKDDFQTKVEEQNVTDIECEIDSNYSTLNFT